MAQFGDVLAGDVLAFEEVEDEPAPAASALSNLSLGGGAAGVSIARSPGSPLCGSAHSSPSPAAHSPRGQYGGSGPGSFRKAGSPTASFHAKSPLAGLNVEGSPILKSASSGSSLRTNSWQENEIERFDGGGGIRLRAPQHARDGSTTRFRRLRLSDGRGITCSDVPPHLRDGLFCGYSDGGVLVAALEPECAAAAAGLLVGDLIVRIGETLATDHAQVIGAIESLRGVSAGACEVTVVDSVMEVLLRPDASNSYGVTMSNLPGGGGVVVSELRAGGPAAAAGLLVGQLLVAADGVLLASHEEASRTLETVKRRGDGAVRLVCRDHAHAVTLDKRRGKIGLTVENNPGAAGVGVVVKSIPPDGVAAAAGLRVGDTLFSIDGTLVYAHDEAVALVDGGGPVLTFVRRH
jgi:hypothetical protein